MHCCIPVLIPQKLNEKKKQGENIQILNVAFTLVSFSFQVVSVFRVSKVKQ